MGAAISAMHYTGMASASFIPSAAGSGPVARCEHLLARYRRNCDRHLDRPRRSYIDVRSRLGDSPLRRQELERRVIERTRQLTTTNEELRKEIEDRQRAEDALQEAQAGLAHVTRVLAMGELVASIAHEINQPLTAVVTNGNFALRQLASRSAESGGAARGNCGDCE